VIGRETASGRRSPFQIVAAFDDPSAHLRSSFVIRHSSFDRSMSQARVLSLDALRRFRAALVNFGQEARAALVAIDLETRRSLEWAQDWQPAYWQQEVRKAEEAVLQAKKDLHRCRATPLPGGGTPACMEERKALERAQRRLAHCEEKVVRTRQWGHTLDHEASEYQGRKNQLDAALDGELHAAIVFLDRTIASLEAYLAEHGPTPAGSMRSAAAGDAALVPNPPHPGPLPTSLRPVPGEGIGTEATVAADAVQEVPHARG
jgi:hypothetical protein